MGAPAYMKFFTGDFFGSTRRMTGHQRAYYGLLLLCMWEAGGDLPDDDAEIAAELDVSLAAWRKVSPVIRRHLSSENGRLFHRKLVAELDKTRAKSEQNRAASKTRWAEKDNENKDGDMRPHSERNANHSHSHSHSQNTPPLSPPGGGAEPKAKANRGSRLSAEWKPAEADRAYATGQGLTRADIDREAERFRNYWTAKAGSGGVKLDWGATWRNWAMRAASDLGRRPSSAQAAPPVTFHGPPEIREAFVAMMGEPWVVGYLDRGCEWQDVPEKAIVARNAVIADRLKGDVRRLLLALGVKVILKERAA